MLDEYQVTGRTRSHVVQIEAPRFAAHPETAAAFLRMREAAFVDGIDLVPFSSFRDFRMQQRIWNGKFLGSRPLYDDDGRVRDRSNFTEDDVIYSILNWSALPGASRHQWGTEIDVVDRSAMAPGYVPKLLPEEVRPGGVFEAMHRWLDGHIHHYGFFRPYSSFQGGMFAEPWHLSYAPVSLRAIDDLSLELLARVIGESTASGKVRILELLPKIYQRHILNITPPPEHL